MRARTLLRVALILLFISLPAVAQDDVEPAPRFHAVTLTGEKFDNASVKGKVLLLQFWTTWCGYCQQEQPLVDNLEKDYADRGLLVLAINVGETKKEVLKYLQENPRTCRVVLTRDTNLAAMFEATRYPIYIVIDREGNVAVEREGAVGESGLRNMLRYAGLKPE